MYDVIIVGAGIAGSYTAGKLAGQGLRVCVLEKNAHAGHKSSCTGIVSRDCFELLPVDTRIVQWQARSAKIFSPSGKYIRVERETTQAYILDRPALDLSIAKQAEASGAEFHFSTYVSGIHKDAKSVRVQGSDKNGQVSFESKVVVIASGFGTSFTKALGLGQINEYAQGAQVEVVNKDIEEVEVYSGTDIAPGFFAWLVPAGAGRAKAGLLCRNNPGPYIKILLEHLQQQGKIEAVRSNISYGAVPLKPLARTYADRLIVIGDAAGQVKPTTGGGIYFGLLCARIAVGTICDTIKNNNFSARNLSVYQKKWHEMLKRELAIDYWAHKFYRKLSDRQIEHIFDILEHHSIHESLLASPDITFDWHSNVILDAIKHRSLDKSLGKLNLRLASHSNNSKRR
ncbi:MAG: NAD(P)/FAD-dependent oxidoreductase [Dehalococcoidia bacterium]|jgi:geranylgeranyl reductase family protein